MKSKIKWRKKKIKYQEVIIIEGHRNNVYLEKLKNNYEKSIAISETLTAMMKEEMNKKIDDIKKQSEEETCAQYDLAKKAFQAFYTLNPIAIFEGVMSLWNYFTNGSKKDQLIAIQKQISEAEMQMIKILKETIEILKDLTNKLEKRIKTKSSVCSIL